jgi:lysophospholipase L1-like esterase
MSADKAAVTIHRRRDSIMRQVLLRQVLMRQVLRSVVALLAATIVLSALGSAEAEMPISAATPVALPSSAAPTARSPNCSVTAERDRIRAPLSRTAQRVADHLPVKIVALGSSSTYGFGASTPEASYPSRLAEELAQRLPDQSITVLNRGINGDEASETLARLDADVIAENPDLVLWQVGTNALLRHSPLKSNSLREGMTRMKRIGADIVLIDPQFAPKYIATTDAERTVSIISAVSAAAHVGTFHRFALMRRWHEIDRLPLDTFLSWDGLHMNDWGYACFAKSIGTAITTTLLGSKTTVSGLATATR